MCEEIDFGLFHLVSLEYYIFLLPKSNYTLYWIYQSYG